MSKFNSTRNKLSKICKLNAENAHQIDNLKNIEIKQFSADFIKQNKEIVLVENLPLISAVTWTGTYQFNNLDTRYLIYLIPYGFWATSEGFNFTESNCRFFYTWEEYNITGEQSILVLHVKATGHIKENGSTIPAPLFLTVKIKTHNFLNF